MNRTPARPANPYDTEEILDRYLLFHHGAPADILPPVSAFSPETLEFPRRCVTQCFDLARLGPGSRALDLGCAVGRSTFELARFCGEAIGVDASTRFIEAAERLRAGETLRYRRLEEGATHTRLEARAPEGIDPTRVRFLVGDAMELPENLGRFDAVLMANLIDRLRDPARCLAGLPKTTNPGATLVIVSPYTWSEEYTPREQWLSSDSRDTPETLRQLLSQTFTLVGRQQLPFLIREHARKYQWSIAEATIWRRV